MLISLYKLNLLVMRAIRAALNTVTNVFIDALNRHSTSVLGVASCRHLIVISR